MLNTEPEFASKSEFKIDKRLRVGGFGAAYLVRTKRNLLTEYVLKEVNLTALNDEWRANKVNENQRERMLQKCRDEHTNMQRVVHPHIVQVFGAFEEIIGGDECYFMVMEFCDGGDLERHLQKQVEPLPEAIIRQWAKQLVAAIHHMHNHKLVHRDINPKNIFLTAFNTKVKLGDFGLVRDLKNQQIKNGSFTSAMTHAYASPEQLEGAEQADQPCDIWAFGITLYEIAHFQRPFEGSTHFKLCHSILNDEPRLFEENRGYSVEYREFTMSMLVKDKNERPDVDSISRNKFLEKLEEKPVEKRGSQSTGPEQPNSSSFVDVKMLADSPLIDEPIRSEICRIMQENFISAADLLAYSDFEISEVFTIIGLRKSVIKWRDAVSTPQVPVSNTRNQTLWKEAVNLMKKRSAKIIKMSKAGDLIKLKQLIAGEIMPVVERIDNNSISSNDCNRGGRVKALLAELMTRNVKDETWYGASPLHIACYNGHVVIAEFLVKECGLDINEKLKNHVGGLPVHLACENGHLNVVEWICDEWPAVMVEARQLDNSTPLHLAALVGQLVIAKYLVIIRRANVECRGGKFNRTPVFMAAQEGHLSLVKFFVEECRADLDVRDTSQNEWSIIHMAAFKGHLSVVEYLVQKRPEFLESKTKHGETPLQLSRAEGKAKVTKFLQSKESTMK